MDSTFQLGVVLSFKDLATSQVNALNDEWKKLKDTLGGSHYAIQNVEKSMSTMKSGMVALGAVGAVGAAFKPAITEARAFEKELAMLKSTSEVSANELQILRSAAIQAGIDTKFSPVEAVQGLTALASASVKGTDNLKNALIPALDMAAASAGKLSIDQAAKDLASAMNSFKRPANEVADTFVKMANIGSFEIQELGAAWRGVNLAASSANQSMATTGAVMTALKNSGSTVVEAGEGARMALSSLTTGHALKELKKLQVSIYEMKDGKEQVRNLIDIFGDLEKSLPKDLESRNISLKKILGDGGVKAFQAVMTQGIDAVRGYESSLQNASGTASSFAKTQIDTFEGSVTMFQGSMQTLKVLLGSAILPALNAVMKGATALLAPTLQWLQTHPLALQYGSILLGVAGAVALLYGITATYVGAMKAYTAIKTAATIANSGYTGSVMLNAAAIFYRAGAAVAGTAVEWGSIAATKSSVLARQMSIAVLGLERTGITASTVLYGVATGKIGLVTAAQWAWNAAMAANPIGMVVVGIVATIAAVAAAIYYWDEWTGAVRRAWEDHKTLFTVIGYLVGPIGWFVIAANVLADNWEKVGSSVTKAISAVKEFFGFATKNDTKLATTDDELAKMRDKKSSLEKANMTGGDEYKRISGEVKRLEEQRAVYQSAVDLENEYNQKLDEAKKQRDFILKEKRGASPSAVKEYDEKLKELNAFINKDRDTAIGELKQAKTPKKSAIDEYEEKKKSVSDSIVTKKGELSSMGSMKGTAEYSKLDSEIKKLEKQKLQYESAIELEKAYNEKIKKLKDERELLVKKQSGAEEGSAASNDFKKGIDKIDSFLNKSKELQLKDIEKELKISVKPVVQKQLSSEDVINMNMGTDWNKGTSPPSPLPLRQAQGTGEGGKMPSLDLGKAATKISVENTSVKTFTNETVKGVTSAVETVPVSIDKLTEGLKKILTTKGREMGNLFSANFKLGLAHLDRAWMDIEMSFNRNLIPILERMKSKAYNSGTGMVQAYNMGVSHATGGKDNGGGAIETVKGWLGGIRDYLPFSDAKKGPLSTLTKSGEAFVSTFAKGVDRGFKGDPLSPKLAQGLNGNITPPAPRERGDAKASNGMTINIANLAGKIEVANDKNGFGTLGDMLAQLIYEAVQGYEVV